MRSTLAMIVAFSLAGCIPNANDGRVYPPQPQYQSPPQVEPGPAYTEIDVQLMESRARKAEQRAKQLLRESRYTGAVIYTKLDGSCAPCERLRAAIKDSGYGRWTVGDGPEFHFWLKEAPEDVLEIPKIDYMRNGQVYRTTTGYSGPPRECDEVENLLRWHPACSQLKTMQSMARQRRGSPVSYGVPYTYPQYYSTPQYYSAPVYGGFGYSAGGGGGGWSCGAGGCVRMW